MSEFDTILNHTKETEAKAREGNADGGKKMTDEDKKKAFAEKQKEKRTQCYSLIDDACLSSVSSPEKMMSFLGIQSHFEKYSLNNNLLIFSQRPDATQIKSFDDWKKAGESIRAGSKSFMILEPHEYKVGDEVRTGYNAKDMFDVSDLKEQKTEPKVALESKVLLRALINKAPASIKIADNYPADKSEGAYYDPKTKTIYARPGMENDAIFTAVAGALAHAELAKGDENYRTADHDFTARCVAYSLAEKYGVPTESATIYSIPPTYKGMEAEDVRNTLSDIHTCIKGISERMREYIEPSRENEKKKDDKGAR